MSYRNIGGDNKDLSYRYKMPRLVTKVEGRGNGIKTRLVNVSDVSKALHRDPACKFSITNFLFFLQFTHDQIVFCKTDVTKYFGCELGAQAKINTKVPEYIVNGAHETSTLDALLDSFIEKYVLCAKCNLPETDLFVKKGTIYAICKACGANTIVDYKHRLDTYITKNPPKAVLSQKAKARQNDDEIAKKANKLEINSDEKNEEWATDTSDAAVEQRMNEAEGAIKDLIQVEDGNILNNIISYLFF